MQVEHTQREQAGRPRRSERRAAGLGVAATLALLAATCQAAAQASGQPQVVNSKLTNATTATTSISSASTATGGGGVNSQMNKLDAGVELAVDVRGCPHQAQHPISTASAVSGDAASLSSSMLRTYIRANNMRAYHLDLHAYRPEAKFSGDPAHVDSRSPAHLQRCGAHLRHYERLLAAYYQSDGAEALVSADSLRLADTFGRPDAGLLDGHQFWLGSYGRCLELSLAVPGGAQRPLAYEQLSSYVKLNDQHQHQHQHQQREERVHSQYCLGLAQFPSWKPEDSKTSVKVGMCLPDTCTSSMLNEQAELFALAERMLKYQTGAGGPLAQLRLRSVYCLPHETSEARQLSLSGKLFVATLSLFLVACLYATLYDYLGRKTADQLGASRTWRVICVESFSMMRNFDKITTASGDPQPQQQQQQQQQQSCAKCAPLESAADSTTLDGAQLEGRFDKAAFFNSITGIKCIGLVWIIAAHTCLVGPITHKNLIGFDQLTKTYLLNLYLAAHLMVDSFFALSGLLASYLLFKSQNLPKIRPLDWLVLTVHRYWRLTPLYLLCFWFAKSLGHLVNSGPLWDYATAAQSPRLACAQEPWWQALLHLSDFKSPKDHCVPFAWFIANGFKFWCVTPLFLTLLYKSRRAGYALAGAALALNMALVCKLAMSSNVDMKSVIEFKPESAENMLNNMDEVYTRPYSRIGAYLVGLLAGHLIWAFEAQGKPLRMSEASKALAWTLTSATFILLTFMLKFVAGLPLDESAIPWLFGLSSALIRPLWAVCTCWLVFALAHGQARLLARFLTASLWRHLAKVSFCAYLLQGEVIANLYLSSVYSSPFEYGEMISRPIVATVITMALSYLVALLVECPLVGIEELILPVKQKNHETHSESTTTTTTTTTINNSQKLDSHECRDGSETISHTTGNTSGQPTGKLKDL